MSSFHSARAQELVISPNVNWILTQTSSTNYTVTNVIIEGDVTFMGSGAPTTVTYTGPGGYGEVGVGDPNTGSMKFSSSWEGGFYFIAKDSLVNLSSVQIGTYTFGFTGGVLDGQTRQVNIDTSFMPGALLLPVATYNALNSFSADQAFMLQVPNFSAKAGVSFEDVSFSLTQNGNMFYSSRIILNPTGDFNSFEINANVLQPGSNYTLNVFYSVWGPAQGLEAYSVGYNETIQVGFTTMAAVPEPSTYAAIMGLGVFVGVVGIRRRIKVSAV